MVNELPFTKPDFTRSIVNITATLAEFLGCENGKPILPDLMAELKKGHKNVVFVILDGLGIHPLEVNLPEDAFLRRHLRQTLTSVFPSTTTNATTSLLTDTYPMEHGWFGWSMYFEELGRTVDLFPGTDSATGEPIEQGYVKRVLPVVPFYKRATADYTTHVVVPPYWDNDDVNRHVWETPDEMFDLIRAVCERPDRQFVYAYCSEPDSTMHRFGVHSAEAKATIGALSARLEALSRQLSDTLFIVTADHGQVDVDGYIELYKDGELLSLLSAPPYLEARATAFHVKEGCRARFEELFARKYGADFALFPSDELIRENYFGCAPQGGHEKLLGDYIAVAKRNRIFLLHERAHLHRGHHASLTSEMLVPLIYIAH